MKVVYVIGPYRGETQWDVHRNVLAAERLGQKVAELGAMPLVPHAMTEHYHALKDDAFWIAGTKELAARSDAGVTVEALGPGYSCENSVGSRGEVDLFEGLDRPVFRRLHDLRDWLARDCGEVDRRPPQGTQVMVLLWDQWTPGFVLSKGAVVAYESVFRTKRWFAVMVSLPGGLETVTVYRAVEDEGVSWRLCSTANEPVATSPQNFGSTKAGG